MAFLNVDFGDESDAPSWRSTSRRSSKDKIQSKPNSPLETPPTAEDETSITLYVDVGGARSLPTTRKSGFHDAFVVVSVGSIFSVKTTMKKNELEPQWNEHLLLRVPVAANFAFATIELFDNDPLGSDVLLGTAFIPLQTTQKRRWRQWFPLGQAGSKHAGHGELFLDALVINPNPISEEVVDAFRDFCASKQYDLNVRAAAAAVGVTTTSVDKHSSSSSEKIDEGNAAEVDTPECNEVISTETPRNSSRRGSVSDDVTVRIPGAAEDIYARFPGVLVSTQSQRAVGDMFLTNFRLVVMCGNSLSAEFNRSDVSMTTPPVSRNGSDESNRSARASLSERIEIENNLDLSQCVPLGLISDVSLKVPRRKSRKITSSRGSSGDLYKDTNKRVVLQLEISCRDFRKLAITISAPPGVSQTQLHDELQIVTSHIEFSIRNMHTQPPALNLGGLNTSKWFVYNTLSEFERQGAIVGEVKAGLMTAWKSCTLNEAYEVTPTYPSRWIVPRCLDDDTIRDSVAFRSKGRLPILCFFNKKVGNALLRCSQPKVGATGRRSEGDEFLVEAVRQISPDPSMIVIFDARSSLAEMGNKLMGKGSEDSKYYRNSKVLFMEIQNIHAVRASADSLKALCDDGSEEKWFSRLEQTGWLKHVQSVLSAGCALARKMSTQELSCIVHCSDGWDRTSQMTSLCQLMLDPYFRTISGFCILIEKEWLSFGHMFTNRTFAPSSPVERSPIFVLFLDCVWQIMQQFPHSFEFDEELLIILADHFQSGYFGNFLCDSERERLKFGLNRSTTSLWSHIDAISEELVVPEYVADGPEVIIPIVSMKRLALWNGYFLRHEFAATSSTIGVNTETEEESENKYNTIVWVPDTEAGTCKDCGLRFTVLRRRHHCRACGRVFCNDCSKNRIALPSFGYDSQQRVCDECYNKHKWDDGSQRAEKYYEKDT